MEPLVWVARCKACKKHFSAGLSKTTATYRDAQPCGTVRNLTCYHCSIVNVVRNEELTELDQESLRRLSEN
jgi:hypothetical protein